MADRKPRAPRRPAGSSKGKRPQAPRRLRTSVPVLQQPPAVTNGLSDAAPAKLPNKVIFSIVYIVGLFLILKSGLNPAMGRGLFGFPGFLIFGTLIYSVWTILWYICMRWPLVGIFIIGTIRSFFGGRGYRRW
jgi:hypothetical protein